MQKGSVRRYDRLPAKARVIREVTAFRKLKKELNTFLEEERVEDVDHVPQSSQLLARVEELFIAGGGGAGRTLPGAFREAQKYGLNVNNVKAVCGTSVGSIVALGVALNLPLDDWERTLNDMPTQDFQDWSWWGSIIRFTETWGLCKGEAMPAYFRRFIKSLSGLDDPTFLELYQAGFTKDLRVVTTNLDKGDLTVFSYRTTPHQKVASAVALSCGVPVLFPPKWIVSPEGKRELHTDGGVLKNYPFGVGSNPNTPLEKQLGIVFVNGATAKNIGKFEKPSIQGFVQYLIALFSAIVFQHPLTLPEPVKQRTIAIRVDHNPFDFTADDLKQARLNHAGAEGVRQFARMVSQRNRKNFEEVKRTIHNTKQPEPFLIRARHAVTAPFLRQSNQSSEGVKPSRPASKT